MKTEYKFIRFEPAQHNTWKCLNSKHNTPLGAVIYFDEWSRHCFFPVSKIVLSAGCLEDIADFIKQLEAGDEKEDTA